jgi:ribosomal protein S18 acetylase RimI-like enzyme
MNEVNIRHVRPEDLEACFLVEIATFPPEEAATRETIQRRVERFPQGFLVAEVDGRVIGMLNGACTNKEDLGDEELKQLVGHDPDGRNMVAFALAVLPEFQRQGIARRLLLHFIDESRRSGKERVMLMCKGYLIHYYERLGFQHVGLSKSQHGGAEWHEMQLSLPVERERKQP